MPGEQAPVVIAYDGSDIAKIAVRRASELFPGRPTVVVTVWEPGLATLPLYPPDAPAGAAIPADPGTVEAVDRAQQAHASKTAREGSELAVSLGLAAEPQVVADEVDVADTVVELARERDAAAVVVGSHGISGLRSRLLGSVARKLIEHCDSPVVVVRGDKH